MLYPVLNGLILIGRTVSDCDYYYYCCCLCAAVLYAFALFQQHTAQGYVSLAVRLGTEEEFAKQALARVEEGYRESLHKNEQSAREWGAFFVRAFRIARFNNGGVPPYE